MKKQTVPSVKELQEICGLAPRTARTRLTQYQRGQRSFEDLFVCKGGCREGRYRFRKKEGTPEYQALGSLERSYRLDSIKVGTWEEEQLACR